MTPFQNFLVTHSAFIKRFTKVLWSHYQMRGLLYHCIINTNKYSYHISPDSVYPKHTVYNPNEISKRCRQHYYNILTDVI